MNGKKHSKKDPNREERERIIAQNPILARSLPQHKSSGAKPNKKDNSRRTRSKDKVEPLFKMSSSRAGDVNGTDVTEPRKLLLQRFSSWYQPIEVLKNPGCLTTTLVGITLIILVFWFIFGGFLVTIPTIEGRFFEIKGFFMKWLAGLFFLPLILIALSSYSPTEMKENPRRKAAELIINYFRVLENQPRLSGYQYEIELKTICDLISGDSYITREMNENSGKGPSLETVYSNFLKQGVAALDYRKYPKEIGAYIFSENDRHFIEKQFMRLRELLQDRVVKNVNILR